MTIVASIAVTIAAGAWLAIRVADASQRVDIDLTTYLLSIPADEWKAEK